MGKTHEALERARKESLQKGLKIIESTRSETVRETLAYPRFDNDYLGPYEHLKTNLLSRYPSNSVKMILFSGTMHGGGCSTTALNFAATLAKNSNIKVLLVEVNLRTPSLKKRLKIENAPDLTDLVANQNQMTSRIERIGSENLYVIGCGGSNLLGPLGLFESGQFDLFLKTVRERFDYVIMDAPPVPIFSEFRVLCSKVDGVVLVIRSEKTRRQVAQMAKKEIQEAGGNLLGVVLNSRKFYIPKWLYKRL